ncbi:MAG: Glutathione S-transferase [Myxococcaceae bacterium]|nr:Glutathione S-transferase [Myxococcaceae bacterium]
MKLFGFKGTRSNRVEWMLREIGADYDFVKVDLQTGQHKQPDHTKRHSHGLVPAFEDGNVQIIESAAACLYLADKAADKGLAPAAGSPESARYYQLAVYAISTLDETIIPLYFQKVIFPPEKRSPAVVDQKLPIWETAAAFLTRQLGEGSYLLGKSFSAVDVIVGYDLALAEQAGLLKGHPALEAYTARLTSREAFKKAYA